MSKGGRFLERKERTTGRGRKAFFMIVGILVVLVLAVGVAAVSYLDGMLDDLNHVEVSKVDYTKATEETKVDQTGESVSVTTAAAEASTSEDYINYLLVGQQSREGEEARLADTMILCTLNTRNKTLTMTSLLRDSFVKMPDYKGHVGGRIKLNAIYHLGSYYGDGAAGSMELMNMTLYNNFGIEVDHNFEVDFEVFVKVVDLLGGVQIELTDAEARYIGGDAKSGLQQMDGEMALEYVRMRNADGDGGSDINRTSRQRKLIEAILMKVRTKNIADLQKMVEEVLPLITTSMSKSEIKETLLTLLPMLTELTIQNGGTCPANYWGDKVDIYDDGVEHSVLRFDVAETTKTMRAITEGET